MAIKTKRAVMRTLTGSSSCSMSGVWRAVTYMEDVAVVFHSPKACAHIAKTMDINAHFRAEARGEPELYAKKIPLVASLLTEKHSIFGGEEQLKECLLHVIETYQPKCIIIASSCVAGVIGDDILSIAEKVEKKSGIPIVATSCSGFLDGEYFEGYFETTRLLIDKFMSAQPVDENSIFLLGDYGGPNSEYVKEIKMLLKLFDLDVAGQFPTYLPFDQLNKLPASSLNIVLGGRKRNEHGIEDIAILLKEKFNTPFYAEHYPFGWKNTVKWLRGLGALLGKEDYAEKAILAQEKRRNDALEKVFDKVRNKKTIFCLGRKLEHFQPQWVLELIALLQLDCVGIVFLDSYTPKDKIEMLDHLKALTKIPLFEESEANHLLDNCELILTTHELDMPNIRQLFLPMLPYAGATGELALVEKIVRLLSKKGKKGEIIYG